MNQWCGKHTRFPDEVEKVEGEVEEAEGQEQMDTRTEPRAKRHQAEYGDEGSMVLDTAVFPGNQRVLGGPTGVPPWPAR